MELSSGTIILWVSGTIPTGWSVYTAATDKLIRGVPSGGTVGATGGASTHTHTAGTVISGGAHTHDAQTFNYSNSSTNAYRFNGTPSVTMAAGSHTHSATVTLASAGSHGHTITATDTGSASNLPPYKKAIYIIKD